MLALMQCTSMYPTDDKDVNLRVIDNLKICLNIKSVIHIIHLVIWLSKLPTLRELAC